MIIFIHRKVGSMQFINKTETIQITLQGYDYRANMHANGRLITITPFQH